jgi:hypothetical protein
VSIAGSFLRRGFRLPWSPLAVKGTLATLAIVALNGLFARFVITLARAFLECLRPHRRAADRYASVELSAGLDPAALRHPCL